MIKLCEPAPSPAGGLRAALDLQLFGGNWTRAVKQLSFSGGVRHKARGSRLLAICCCFGARADPEPPRFGVGGTAADWQQLVSMFRAIWGRAECLCWQRAEALKLECKNPLSAGRCLLSVRLRLLQTHHFSGETAFLEKQMWRGFWSSTQNGLTHSFSRDAEIYCVNHQIWFRLQTARQSFRATLWTKNVFFKLQLWIS